MNLATAMLNTAELLMEVRRGIATGGSATTVVDTTCNDPDEYYDNGMIWLLSGNNANKTEKITTWDNATSTFTFATMTTLCAAADRYAVAIEKYPRQQLLAAVNMALDEIGPVAQVSTTAFTPATSTLSFSLASGIYNIKKVEIIDTTGAVDTNYWWKEINGVIYFDDGKEPATGTTARVYYLANHTEVTTDAGTISNYINPVRLAWTAAWHASVQRWKKFPDEDGLAAFIELANNKATMLRRQYPAVTPDLFKLKIGAW